MVSLSPASDLQQTIPVRPTRPIAPRQQQEQDLPQQQSQVVERDDRNASVSDQEIERAIRAAQQNRNPQQQLANLAAQDTILDNSFEEYNQGGYTASGMVDSRAYAGAGGRGQYIDFYA